MSIMAKTTKELGFDNLYMEYRILRKVNKETAKKEFQKLFAALIQDCAVKMYNGNASDINLHKALYNNLVSDKRTRFTNVDRYYNGYLPDRAIRLELVDIIDEALPKELRMIKKDKADKAAGTVNKSYWKYNEEDIEAVTDTKVLDSIINNIATAKSRMLDQAMKEFDLTEEEVKERFDALRKLAREQKEKLNAPQLSEGLVDKLQKGTKTTLSAAEVAELLQALNK